MISRLILAFLLLISAEPAHAGPFAAIIPIIVGAVVKSAILKIVLTIALTAAVSALTKATQKKAVAPGIQTERKLTGGVNSRTVVLGYYATAGSEVCPPMSHGQSGKTPNAYLTIVVALSDTRTHSLRRLVINGEYVDFNAGVTQTYGHPIGGKYAGKAWVRFYNGAQTVADPTLVSVYNGYIRPWTNDKIGTGVSYAVLTWLYDADLYKGEPEVKFELWGMPLYDPRKDTTAGGSGSHRFNDPSTWEITFNNIVMVYNILRGISFPDGTKYGGECTAADLPLANWAAGMNVCDEVVTTSAGTEARYRAGFEVSISDMEPATVVEELLKGCSAEIVEAGGIYKVQVGPPALPVMFITDGDFLVNQPRDFDPFPSFTNAKNMVYATYPSPGENWNNHEAPVITDQDYLDRDQGVEMPASLQLPTVPFPFQVQRLMKGWLKDDQRWRQHSATLGHYGFILEPLDTIAWTSAHNQYDAKLFQIESCTENLSTLNNTVALREVDPEDYDYTVADELPDPITPGTWDLPPVQAVPGFGAVAVAIQDASGNDRRPAIRAYWDADAAADATLIRLQVEQPTTGDIISVVGQIAEGEQIIADGILPDTIYRVRGQFVVDRPTEWSSWFSITTLDIRLGELDLEEEFQEDLIEALDRIADAESDISVLQGQASDLVDQVAGIEADFGADITALQGSMATAQADILAAEGDISTLETTVATQGSAISTNATAISNTAGNLATLTTRVNASSINMLKNPTFDNGFVNWTVSGSWTRNTWGADGSYYVNTNGDGYIYSDEVNVTAGYDYTISANMSFFSDSGQFYIRIIWYDASHVNFSSSAPSYKTRGVTFSDNLDGRVRVTATAPVGAAFARVFAYATGTSGLTGASIKEVKFERGSVMSPFTQDAAITQNYTAISTLDGQYATLSSTVSTQGSLISTNATAISTLNSNYASLSSTVSAQGASITTNASAITTLQGQYSTLSSTVSTQGTSISTNAAAISTLNTNVGTLTTKVNASAINIIKNPTFANGFTNWTAVGSWTRYETTNQGIFVNIGGDGYIYSDSFTVTPGTVFTLSANMYFISASGTFGMYIYWYDAADANLTYSTIAYKTRGQGWATDNDGRTRVTVTVPSGAVYGRVWLLVDGTSGTTSAAIREVKLEASATMSPFTQDAAVAQNYQAISTLDTQYASLSSTVSTQGTSISTNATAISTLNTNYASLSSTVTTQGGLISTNASAITTLSGTVSSLSSTVSAQGASISTNTSAISTANGNITTLFARYAMTLDVNGYITGWELNNNGSYGNAKFNVDNFEIGKSGSGPKLTWVSGGALKTHDGTRVRVQMGNLSV
jgi:uncharacterized coiled-coil protein SlyX